MASRNHPRKMDESNRRYPGQGGRHPKIAPNSNCTTHRSRPKPSPTVSLYPTDDTTDGQSPWIPRIADPIGTTTMHLRSRTQDIYLRVLANHAPRPRLDGKRCHRLLRPNHSQHRSRQQLEWVLQLLNYSHSRNPPCAPARTHGQIQAPREPPN
jgi:hypothetical protein